MKKIIALLLAVLCVFAICSCAARPAMKLDEAEANLKAKDYIVTYTKDSSMTGVAERLTARASLSLESDLEIVVYDTAKLARFAYEEAKLSIDTEIEYINMEIKKTEYVLKQYKDELKSAEIDELEDDIKDLKEELAELENIVIGRSGKTFWQGTKQAIKDSKK